MNHAFIGSKRAAEMIAALEQFDDPFILFDDGPIIDALNLPDNRTVTYFDPLVHSFDILQGMNHIRARQLANVFYAVAPEGPGTLTVRNGRRTLARLLNEAERLDEISGNRKDPAIVVALAVIDDVLFSPLLRDVLCKEPNFSFKGRRAEHATIIARLDRALLGEEDCFALANFLITQYGGTVVIPDFAFYGAKFHRLLYRQNRLMAGVNFLDEAPDFRNFLLLFEKKTGAGCTPEDAATLADLLSGYRPGQGGHTKYIEKRME